MTQSVEGISLKSLYMHLGKTDVIVLISTYNGSMFLREHLDSLLAQTRLPDRIVICDDCSTDDTPDTSAATLPPIAILLSNSIFLSTRGTLVGRQIFAG